jgi:hypothetical protein
LVSVAQPFTTSTIDKDHVVRFVWDQGQRWVKGGIWMEWLPESKQCLSRGLWPWERCLATVWSERAALCAPGAVIWSIWKLPLKNSQCANKESQPQHWTAQLLHVGQR